MVRPGLMPGVVREDLRPVPREVFRTGVPAFLGFAAGPPTGPDRLDRFGDLALGDVGGAGHLTEAVRGFFANGGTTCQVVTTDPATDPVAAVREGLARLELTDDVDLLVLPDLAGWAEDAATRGESLDVARARVVAAQRAVLEHCAGRGDRFAVLDALPDGAEPVIAQRRQLAGPAAAFGALYHPWIRVPAADGSVRYAPPSGHVAGSYAAVDEEVGVHRAPANRALLGVLDVAQDVGESVAAALHEAGVNPLRVLPGRGIRVWGARTLSDDPAWRSVPVRRLVSVVGRWAEEFLASAVHEPNDVRLWVRITRELTAALDVLHRAGAFAGLTAPESFYVKCDQETNPPEVVAAGLVVTEIGVAPAVPAEFVVVRVIQGADAGVDNAA